VGIWWAWGRPKQLARLEEFLHGESIETWDLKLAQNRRCTALGRYGLELIYEGSVKGMNRPIKSAPIWPHWLLAGSSRRQKRNGAYFGRAKGYPDTFFTMDPRGHDGSRELPSPICNYGPLIVDPVDGPEFPKALNSLLLALPPLTRNTPFRLHGRNVTVRHNRRDYRRLNKTILPKIKTLHSPTQDQRP